MSERVSGPDWLDAYLQAQGAVQFEIAWLSFSLGQAGAFFETSREELPLMLAQLEQNIVDLERALPKLTAVCREILANARHNYALADPRKEGLW